MTDRALIRLITLFDNKVLFGVTLVTLLIVILVPYFIWALQQKPPKPEWNDVVRLQQGAFLQLDFDIATLTSQFRVDAVSEARERAENYMTEMRGSALQLRRITYGPAALLACQVASWDQTGPSILAVLSRNQRVNVAVDGGARTVLVPCDEALPPQSENEDTLLRSTPPQVVLAWVQKIGAQISGGCAFCTQSVIDSYQGAQMGLEEAIQSENDIVETARNHVRSLAEGVSFGFLYAKKYGWLVHLWIWSWVGVITAGIAHLVVMLQNREERSGLSFVFISFRLFTAPIIGSFEFRVG